MSRWKPDVAILRLLVFVGALVGALVLLFWGRAIFTPVILGLAIAYLFDPVVSWFERKRRSRLLGVLVLLALLLILIAVVLLWAIPVLGDQARDLEAQLPEYRARLERELLPRLEEAQRRYPVQFEFVKTRLGDALRERAPQIAESLVAWVGRVFDNTLALLGFLFDLVFVPVFAFYLLLDFPKLRSAISELVPVPYRKVVYGRVGEVDTAVSSFVRGQLLVATILGVIDGVLLTAIGVPFGLGVGFVAGLTNVIPYMALVAGLPVALLLAWLKTQSFGILALVAAAMFGAQVFEGTWLTPKILGRTLHLHPVWILLAVSAGGRLFGIIGMLVAVPAAASIQVFIRHWMASFKKSKMYLGEEGAATAAKQ